MIIRREFNWWIILRNSWGFVVYALAASAAAHVLYDRAGLHWVALPFPVLGTLGTALAIFLAFRSNSSYDRWWEARKIWGGIVNSSRTWSRQVTTLLGPERLARPADVQDIHRELVYRHLAWINALRLQLRKQSDWEVLSPFLDRLEHGATIAAANPATQLIHQQSVSEQGASASVEPSHQARLAA